MSKCLSYLKEYFIIKRSGLFNANYYYQNYPDVRHADINPLLHYILNGWKEGRNPSEYFNTNYYLLNNVDVRDSGINPLVHFLKFGAFVDRDLGGCITTSPRVTTYDDGKIIKLNRLSHLLILFKLKGKKVSGIEFSDQLLPDQKQSVSQQNLIPSVTVVITSCGRYDLLRKTINGFLKFNTYPVEDIIVIEDGKLDDVPNDLIFNSRLNFIETCAHIGQIKAIDRAYQHIKSDYIFHCEDDWEFFHYGFIEKSVTILKNNSNIIQVWLRAFNDTNGRHPENSKSYYAEGIEYKILEKLLTESGIWYGFSFNPGLKRLSDYRLLGSYKSLDPNDNLDSGQLENMISKFYFDQGFVAAILADNSGKGYCKHIGSEHRLSKS